MHRGAHTWHRDCKNKINGVSFKSTSRQCARPSGPIRHKKGLVASYFQVAKCFPQQTSRFTGKKKLHSTFHQFSHINRFTRAGGTLTSGTGCSSAVPESVVSRNVFKTHHAPHSGQRRKKKGEGDRRYRFHCGG